MTEIEPGRRGGRPAGRRAARVRRPRVDATVIAAVLLVLLGAGAVALVRPAEPAPTERPPVETTLTTATVVCPAGQSGSSTLSLASAVPGARGEVAVGAGGDVEQVAIEAGETTTIEVPAASSVTGEDDLAPGLVAARTGGGELAAAGCRPPTSQQWFTGVGAGAGHTSILELTNPDRGTAVVDVALLGRDGLVDSSRLRGVAVAGGATARLELGRLVPRTDDLAIEVTTTQGRVGVSVLDRVDRVGPERATQDWLPGRAEPEETLLLLGIAPGEGRRYLTVANPGATEVRAEVRIVTAASVFAPEGLTEVRVPPQSTRRIPITAVLRSPGAEGALGLQVRASGPVTASLRSIIGGDLSHAAGGRVDSGDEAIVLLPAGARSGSQATTKTLVLAGAPRAGAVQVISLAADGSELASDTVEIIPEQGARIALPPRTVQVRVTPARTEVTGAILVSRRDGATVLPLEVPVTAGLVPVVRPGLP